MEHQEVLRVLRALQDAGVDYIMIGAMAMGIHGVVRATQGVDLLVRAETGNIERIRSALRAIYPEDQSVEEIRDDDLLGDYAVVRYCPPSGDYYFDFISRLAEVVTFESVESEVKDVGGARSHCHAIGHISPQEGHGSPDRLAGRKSLTPAIPTKGR